MGEPEDPIIRELDGALYVDSDFEDIEHLENQTHQRNRAVGEQGYTHPLEHQLGSPDSPATGSASADLDEPDIPTVLSQWHGSLVKTKYLEYVHDLREYPRTDPEGFTYVVSVNSQDPEEIKDIWHSVCSLF